MYAWLQLVARQPERSNAVSWLRVVARRKQSASRNTTDAWPSFTATDPDDRAAARRDARLDARDGLTHLAALPAGKRALLTLQVSGHTYARSPTGWG